MQVTTIRTRTEQEQHDRSVCRAEKRPWRAWTGPFYGLISHHFSGPQTAGDTCRAKHLTQRPDQAIFLSIGRPFGAGRLEITAMAFKFWGGADAENEFRDDIMTVHRNSGYTGCYPVAKTQDVWSKLRIWSAPSRTARDLFRFIDESKQVIHVVGMSGGFQCFGSAQGSDHKKGVIFVDLDAKLMIIANTSHNLHLPMDVMSKLWKGTSGGNTRADLDNRITLLHEIGHARQWIEKPGWFDNDYRTATKVGVGDAAKTMKDLTAAEILRLATAKAGAGGASFLPKTQAGDAGVTQKMKSPVVWGVPIEHDNMRRHEWKICREMGLPLRSNYGDIADGGSAKNSSLTTQMFRWIKEDEEAMAAKNAARIERPATVCTVCNVDFKSFIKLNAHKMVTRHMVD